MSLPQRITPNMRRGLEIMLAHPTWTYAKIAKEVGCSEATVKKWKYHELFQEELDKKLREEWKDARINAQKMMKQLSDNGDFNATKYILDSNGYQAPQQVELNNNNIIKVTIDDEASIKESNREENMHRMQV